MKKDRTRHAQTYQHKFVECRIDYGFYCSLPDVFQNRLHHEEDYDDEIALLRDSLMAEYWRLIDTVCTQRQAEILHLTAEGLSQKEIAEKLEINQSSVVKSILGNRNYSKDKLYIYGGSFEKLRKAMDKDEKIQDILAKIQSIKDNKII